MAPPTTPLAPSGFRPIVLTPAGLALQPRYDSGQWTPGEGSSGVVSAAAASATPAAVDVSSQVAAATASSSEDSSVFRGGSATPAKVVAASSTPVYSSVAPTDAPTSAYSAPTSTIAYSTSPAISTAASTVTTATVASVTSTVASASTTAIASALPTTAPAMTPTPVASTSTPFPTLAATPHPASAASSFFSSLTKSPVSIVLTVLVSIGILAVLLGIIAFFVRRNVRRRKREATTAAVTNSQGWGGPAGAGDWEKTTRDRGELDEKDIVPEAVWARRMPPSHGRPMSAVQEEEETFEERMRNGRDRPAEEWTTFGGGGGGHHSWDSQSGMRPGQPFLIEQTPPQPRKPSRYNQFAPPAPTAFNPASSYTLPPSRFSDPRPQFPIPFTLTPARRSSTLEPIESAQAAGTWKESLDRVMGATLSYVAARPLSSHSTTSEPRDVEAAQERLPSPEPRAPVADPRRIPSTYTPLPSTYSAQFARPLSLTPSVTGQLPRYPLAVAPAPQRPTISSDLSFGQKHLDLQRAISDATSTQSHGTEAGFEGARGRLAKATAENEIKWNRSAVGMMREGSDESRSSEGSSDGSGSWRVNPPSSSKASASDFTDTASEVPQRKIVSSFEQARRDAVRSAAVTMAARASSGGRMRGGAGASRRASTPAGPSSSNSLVPIPRSYAPITNQRPSTQPIRSEIVPPTPSFYNDSGNSSDSSLSGSGRDRIRRARAAVQEERETNYFSGEQERRRRSE